MRGMILRAEGALLRAIHRLLEESGGWGNMVVEATDTDNWASATFTGHRHRLEMRFTGGDAAGVDALVKRLGEAELVVPGHIVASVDLVEHQMLDGDPRPVHRLALDVLTIVD